MPTRTLDASDANDDAAIDTAPTPCAPGTPQVVQANAIDPTPTNTFTGGTPISAGEVNFVPDGWAPCDGSIYPIAGNEALFSTVGTTYGGNGTENFALPDLRSRSVVGVGEGSGLNPYVLGEIGGQETVTLTHASLPPHSHSFTLPRDGPVAVMPAVDVYAGRDSTFVGESEEIETSSVGGGLPVGIVDPYLVLTCAIRVDGPLPMRP